MIRTYLLLVSALLLTTGCDGTSGTEAAGECSEFALQDQCPVGSNPILGAMAESACGGSASADLVTNSGSVTGSCQGSGSCQILCQFDSPCRCGVDRITRAEIVCTECPDDLTSCTPSSERCNGLAREICNQDGDRWDTIACGAGASCVPDGPDRTRCDDSCEAGTANCDGDLDDGCEALQSIDHCGGCGQACTITNGQGTCTTGTCEVASCDAGREDLNGLASDGCEAVCTPDTQRCNDDELETCSATGQWELTETCGDDSPHSLVILIPTCRERRGVLGCFACENEGQSRCGDFRDTSIEYVCNANGEYDAVNCGQGLLQRTRCTDTHPLGEACYECYPNDRECGPDENLYVCNADGAFEMTPCADGCTLGNGGSPFAQCL